MQKTSGKETYLVTNTLNCLPFLLDGQSVLIDLRNETSVVGRIDATGTDGCMNINLTDAVFIDRDGLQYAFEQFMARPRMIRQIHLPAHLEAESAIRDWLDHGRRPAKHLTKQRKGKLTYKQKRAEQRHKEVLDEIGKAKQEGQGGL